jgi:prepilin-type N-terminal cleavage/methylation domain-containing protein
MRQRRAFTFIELLVVIAIILILMALALGAVFQVMSTWQQRQTEITVRKLHTALREQYRQVIKLANEEPLPAWAVQLADGDPRRARAIYLKARLRQEFPMSFAEVQDPSPLPPVSSYLAYLTGVQGGHDENAVCLYMILRHSRGGALFEAEASLGASHITDPRGDGKLEIADGWGKPIRFYRWPIGDPELGPLPGAHDPADPDATLAQPWNGQGQFSASFHPVVEGGSWKLEPVVVSAGADGEFGLDLRFMIPTSEVQSWDNVYSHRLTRAD